MDAALLTSANFWDDTRPFAMREIPDMPELDSHVLFETSGSTGRPKWVALSKRALLTSADAVNLHLCVDETSCWGIALPLHHVGGFGVAARAYAADCKCVSFDQRWQPVAFQKWIENHAVTHTSLVPTQVHDLVARSLAAPPSLTAVVVGGGHLPQAIGQAARNLGWPVLASYGMTESASQIATQGLELLNKSYQDSPIPLLPIWQTKLSEDAQLSIAGPALFSGYLTEKGFAPRTSKWHLTADRVALDSTGLRPISRADALVKVMGELVDLEAIERELSVLSNGELVVGDFAVIALSDARAEHRLIPVFEMHISADLIATVIHYYHDRAPKFSRLGEAIQLPEFPRSELGKIRRSDLKKILENNNV